MKCCLRESWDLLDMKDMVSAIVGIPGHSVDMKDAREDGNWKKTSGISSRNIFRIPFDQHNDPEYLYHIKQHMSYSIQILQNIHESTLTGSQDSILQSLVPLIFCFPLRFRLHISAQFFFFEYSV